MCLEEMLGCAVSEGALYYGEKRRRVAVVFDTMLREATVQAAAEVHALLAEGKTPAPRYAERCEGCSLLPLCLPKVATCKQVAGYLRNMAAT
jgi:CRISPR-associated exonuclease Cas4